MSSFQDYQQQFAQALERAIRRNQKADTSVEDNLANLIDALPYYGNPDMQLSLHQTLANLMECYLPNDFIAAQPTKTVGLCTNMYSYNGPYNGYQNAFFNGVVKTTAAMSVYSLCQGVSSTYSSSWWSNYAVSVLTDCIRQNASVSIDTNKLASDLQNDNTAFMPALTASYLGALTWAYVPTYTALNVIKTAGQTQDACDLLVAAITDNQFTANINQAISMGGMAATAAIWFEYNLWVTLTALGAANVNGIISSASKNGLNVPYMVGPNNWWNGTFNIWYTPVSGNDVLPQAQKLIGTDMPESMTSMCNGIVSSPASITESNGYTNSFCSYGQLAWYKPSSSCFGKNTGVLMADGSVKKIEEIKVGDMIKSAGGPRKVLLVEAPLRGNRTLYQLNGQNVYATPAHPFRSGEEEGPKRLAADAWGLIDTVPPMAAEGVGLLQKDAVLAGYNGKDNTKIKIKEVKTHEPASSGEEKVYDLIVENWEKDKATYFVGGPDVFFETDAESSDPLYDIPVTAGIIAAMDLVLPEMRKQLKDPATTLPHLLSRLHFPTICANAREKARPMMFETPLKLRIPGPDYYQQNNEWDITASSLENMLVQYFGYHLRRETAAGWRPWPLNIAAGNHLAVTLHDLTFDALHAIPAGADVQIRLSSKAGSASWQFKQKSAAWFMQIDEVTNLGEISHAALPLTFSGEIFSGETVIAKFSSTAVHAVTDGRSITPFLFSPTGEIIGRIALAFQWTTPLHLAMAAKIKTQWGRHQAVCTGHSIGRQIGLELMKML